jgi:hypothetical protein
LLLKNKSLIDVAINLDLPKEQVLKIHSDYLILRYRQEIESILEENKNNRNFLHNYLIL